MAEKSVKIIAQNRKAYHDYFVVEKYEAGIALHGTEVKSIRAGTVNLKESYCEIRNGEIYAVGFHISPYDHGNIYNHEPMRDKKLLMHKKEILKLHGLISQKGYNEINISENDINKAIAEIKNDQKKEKFMVSEIVIDKKASIYHHSYLLYSQPPTRYLL